MCLQTTFARIVGLCILDIVVVLGQFFVLDIETVGCGAGIGVVGELFLRGGVVVGVWQQHGTRLPPHTSEHCTSHLNEPTDRQHTAHSTHISY